MSLFNFFKKHDPNKIQLTFFVSTGRCGTTYLSKIMEGKDHYICHEKEHIPCHDAVCQNYMPIAQSNDPFLIKSYVEEVKLPQIKQDLKSKKTHNYIDTGHQINYGIIPYLMENYPKTKWVRLRRDRYQTTLSFMTMPEENDIWNLEEFKGYFRWMMHPNFAITQLPVEKKIWIQLNRFQKVLWAVDEVERQWQYFLNTFKFSYIELNFNQIIEHDLDHLKEFLGVEISPKGTSQEHNSSQELKREKPNFSQEQMKTWDLEMQKLFS